MYFAFIKLYKSYVKKYGSLYIFISYFFIMHYFNADIIYDVNSDLIW